MAIVKPRKKKAQETDQQGFLTIKEAGEAVGWDEAEVNFVMRCHPENFTTTVDKDTGEVLVLVEDLMKHQQDKEEELDKLLESQALLFLLDRFAEEED